MNNIQNTKNRKNNRSFLFNTLLIAFLFILNVSAIGNGVTNAGNINARIANPLELGSTGDINSFFPSLNSY